MNANRSKNALARNPGHATEQEEGDRLLQSMRAHSRDIDARLARAEAQARAEKQREMKLQDLSMLSLSPILRSVQNWWLQRAERHFLICADVELQRMREAEMNIAYYQKRAAMARSARTV